MIYFYAIKIFKYVSYKYFFKDFILKILIWCNFIFFNFIRSNKGF